MEGVADRDSNRENILNQRLTLNKQLTITGRSQQLRKLVMIIKLQYSD
jgi:hypothetical protein